MNIVRVLSPCLAQIKMYVSCPDSTGSYTKGNHEPCSKAKRWKGGLRSRQDEAKAATHLVLIQWFAMYFAPAFNKASIKLIQYCSVLGIPHIRVIQMALRLPTWSISMCWIRVTSRRCWCRATRAVDSHIFQMDTVVRSNRISSAGDQSWFCTRTPDIVQQDRSGCRTIATRKKKICHRIPSIAHSKPSMRP